MIAIIKCVLHVQCVFLGVNLLGMKIVRRLIIISTINENNKTLNSINQFNYFFYQFHLLNSHTYNFILLDIFTAMFLELLLQHMIPDSEVSLKK